MVRVTGYDPATGRRRVRQLGTFDTKRAAVAHQKAAAGGSVDTLADFLETVWLPGKEGRVETSTFEQYRWAVTRHIVPLIGAVRLGDLRPEVVDAWLAQISVAPDWREAEAGGDVVAAGAQGAVDGEWRRRCSAASSLATPCR